MGQRENKQQDGKFKTNYISNHIKYTRLKGRDFHTEDPAAYKKPILNTETGCK